MALERRNPLPKGVYWIDAYSPPVGGNSIDAVTAWVKRNSPTRIVVLKSVYQGSGSDPFLEFVRGSWSLSPGLALIANALPDAGRERAWLLFQVKEPTDWPAKEFGFPTKANIRTEEENTSSGTDPEPGIIEAIEEATQSAQGLIKAAPFLIAGGLAIAILLRRR